MGQEEATIGPVSLEGAGRALCTRALRGRRQVPTVCPLGPPLLPSLLLHLLRFSMLLPFLSFPHFIPSEGIPDFLYSLSPGLGVPVEQSLCLSGALEGECPYTDEQAEKC